jgi:pentatricopeptide repeat protein
VGGFCTVAALTYEAHRRVRIAEKIIDNKRTLHNTAPNYDATSAAKRLKVMVEAAEAGEFMGIQSLKARNRNLPDGPHEPGSDKEAEAAKYPKPKPMMSLEKRHARSKNSMFGSARIDPTRFKKMLDTQSYARNEAALAREKKQSEEAQEKGQLPLEEEIRRLINEDREINAANLFLAATQYSDAISWERRELACHVFTANCIKGNMFIARTLFHRLDKFGFASEEMWATLMHLLAKEGHIDSVGALYDRFRASFVVPNHLLEVILRCLIESRRLDSAKFLFFHRFKDDRDCGLCGAYLDGIWRKTRSMELVSAQLGLIIERLKSLGRKPTEKLFNPVVKAMVETGRAEEAEDLVKSMQETYGAKPGCRTIGLIVYSRALNCEWDRVMDGLRAMHEHGYASNTKDFAIVFDRVFLEYYPTHSADQILDFLISSINDFDIVPDKVLHRHMLEAIIERGTEDMIDIITDMARDRNWNTGFTQSQIRSLVKSRRLAMTDSPVGIWRMMQAAKQSSSQSASSRRILGSSAETWAVRGEKIAPIHIPAEESYPKTLSSMVAHKSASLYVPLHKRMEQCINTGKYNEVLAIYDQASRGGFIVRPVHLKLAVIAAILGCKKTGIVNARRLITSEWDYWKNVPSLRYTKRFTSWTPMFFQRVMKVDPSALGRAGLIKMAMFEYYSICANTDGLLVKHFCAASSSRNLISDGAPELAVDLLTTIYQSRWRISHGFDQVLLKMLLRGYAGLNNLKGVWWCVLTVLSRDEPIKQDFVVEATSQLASLENSLLPTDSSESKRQLRILRETIEVLELKLNGDPHWSTIHVNTDRKKAIRAKGRIPPKRQHLLPTTSLENLMTDFDEERELDLLLRRKLFTRGERKKWWAESNMSILHSASAETPEYPSYESETWDGYYVPEEYSGEYHLEFEKTEVGY